MGAGQSQEQRVTFEKQPDGGVFVLSRKALEQLSDTGVQDSDRIEQLAKNEKVKKLMHKAYTEGARNENQRMENIKFQEISELNSNWQQKVDEIKRNADLDKKVTTEEFNKAADEFRLKFKSQSGLTVCQEFQDTLVNCLNNNTSKPLVCSKEVKAFSECVNSYKLIEVNTNYLQKLGNLAKYCVANGLAAYDK